MKPFPPEVASSVGATLFLFLAAWFGSSLLVRRWLPDSRWSLCFAVAFLAWNTAIILGAEVLSLTGWYSRGLFFALPLLAVLVSSLFVAIRPNFWERLRQTWPGWPEDPLFWSAVFVLASGLIYLGFYTFLYPASAWDTFQYHRPISLMFLQEGRLLDLPSVSWAVVHYPKNGEIIAAWMLAVSGWDTPARMLPWMHSIVIVASVYSMLRAWKASSGSAAALAASALMAPVFVITLIRDTGDIDINVASVFLTGLAALVQSRESETPGRLGAVAGLAAAMLLGLKGNGMLYAFVLFALWSGTLIHRWPGWKRVAGMVSLWAAMGLALSSYWWIWNWAAKGNPLYPIEIHVGGLEFPGVYKPTEIMSVGIPESIAGKSKLGQLWGSVRVLDNGGYLFTSRLGGFGYLFFWLGLAGWGLGLVASLLKRQWQRAFLLSACLGLFFLMPSNWWARYVLFAIALSPLAYWAFLEALPSCKLRNLLVSFWFIFGTVMLPFFILDAQRDIFHFSARQEAERRGRNYLIAQDVFQSHFPQSTMRDFYRGLALAEVPENVRIGNIHPDLMETLLYRPALKNKVSSFQLDDPTLEEKFDMLILNADNSHIVDLLGRDWKFQYNNNGIAILYNPRF